MGSGRCRQIANHGTGEASRRHISIQWYTRLLAQGRYERGPIGTLQGFRSRLVAAWSVAACFLVQLRAAPHPHWHWWLQVSTKRLILSRCERSVLQEVTLTHFCTMPSIPCAS